MDSQENVPAPRFRIVLEASFPAADPVDPAGYDDLFASWKRALETDPVAPCEGFDHPAPADEERGFKPLRVEPDYADAHIFLAMILSQIPGRREDAIAECKRALKLRPGFEAARRQLERLQAR
jgi:hypothetical protein